MAEGNPFSVTVGQVGVVTTNDRGHSPEFFAQRIIDRLIVVADSAPPPIRDQAYAFRDRMHAVVLDGIKQAILSDRAYREGK